jgi:molybdenum cofactor biosynthesis enzyme
MVNKAKTVRKVRKVSSKIMDKASNNLVVNNQVNKVNKLAIVRMEITRMARTNSSKVRPKTPIKDNRVNNPISSKTNNSRTKTRTVRTTTTEMASLMT